MELAADVCRIQSPPLQNKLVYAKVTIHELHDVSQMTQINFSNPAFLPLSDRQV